MLVKIYGTDNCKWCKQAQRLCLHNNIDYTYDHVSEIIVPKGWKTVPVIFVDDQFIGGYEDLENFLNDNT